MARALSYSHGNKTGCYDTLHWLSGQQKKTLTPICSARTYCSVRTMDIARYVVGAEGFSHTMVSIIVTPDPKCTQTLARLTNPGT